MNMPVDCLVIGAGPAGLMAAETVSAAGFQVIVADAMPSPARKFLMAGKSGLNLTHASSIPDIAEKIIWGEDGMAHLTRRIIEGFSSEDICRWAENLGIPLFTGSTGRVFPEGMKASPLLRAWLGRLAAQGVELRRRWRWTGIENGSFVFDTTAGRETIIARKTVLALGGASWPRLGSDGGWAAILGEDVKLVPFRPANMGFSVDWSPAMQKHFGAPVKGVMIEVDGLSSRGEWVITKDGIEGGGIYKLAAAIRDGGQPCLDLAPDIAASKLALRLGRQAAKTSFVRKLRNVLGDPVRVALALEWAERLPSPEMQANALKHIPMRLGGPFGLEHAISSAGGIAGSGLTQGLALNALPDIHVAGEMLDWEAPTGGYLLSMCLASGRYAGNAVTLSLQESVSSR